MELIKDYTPGFIEFGVKTNEVPQTLGEFKNLEEATQFINQNFVAIPQKLETTRLMDDYEREAIREEYRKELEEKIPVYKKELQIKTLELEEAKTAEKNAKEILSATWNKIDILAKEVNDGVTEINLDAASTFKIAHKGNYYFYTFVNSEITLAKIMQIPEFERDEIFNSSERNKESFEELKKASNG